MSDEEEPRQTALRILCECGGQLGVVSIPSEEVSFVVVCSGCGTRYRRQMTDLAKRATPGEIAAVVLPRSRPRG